MNVTDQRRRIAYQGYPSATFPLDGGHGREARAVELILAMGYDSEHPWRNTLAALQGIRPDLTTDAIDERIGHLLDLAEKVAELETEPLPRQQWSDCVDDYLDALHDFASGAS